MGIVSKTKSRLIGLFASHVDQLCRILQKLCTLNSPDNLLLHLYHTFAVNECMEVSQFVSRGLEIVSVSV